MHPPVVRSCSIDNVPMAMYKLALEYDAIETTRKLILPRSDTRYILRGAIYISMHPIPYMALSTLFLI